MAISILLTILLSKFQLYNNDQIANSKQKMLSKRPYNNKSPVKENLSPSKYQARQDKQNNIQLAKELFTILHNENISISSHLQEQIMSKFAHKTQTSEPFSLKSIDNQECLAETRLKVNKNPCNNVESIRTDPDLRSTVKTQESKALQIKLSDCQFQLKKTEEDFAQHKVMTRMEKQKIIKKSNQEIQTLKRRVEDDNNNWEIRFKKTLQDQQEQKQQFKKDLLAQTEHKLLSETQKLKSTYLAQIFSLQDKVLRLQGSLTQLKTQSKRQKEQMNVVYRKEKKLITESLKQTNLQQQKEVVERFEHKIKLTQTKKKEQACKLQEKIDQQIQLEEKLRKQLYYMQKDKKQLKNEIKIKQDKITQMELTIKTKQKQLNQQVQKLKQQTEKIKQEHIKEVEQLKYSHKIETSILKKDHLDELDNYYSRINKIDQAKMQIENQHKESLQILETRFYERTSKCEDIELINDLKSSLNLKQRELVKAKEDCRKKELILKNNQKNYTRLFSSTCGQRKSSVNSHRDKQAFFRQNNTTDLKMVLKICNKQF